MKKKGYSKEDLYDEIGRKTGQTRQGLFNQVNHYDENGKRVGSSKRGFFGKLFHSDK